MSSVLQNFDPASLGEQLRGAHAVTRPLMLDLIDKACRRFPSLGQSERTARLSRLIDAEAWADAALVLLQLELPLWQVRRIAYDEGEWYCALSREHELPDWLESSVEGRHSDLALALLSFRRGASAHRRSDPAERAGRSPDREPPLRAGQLRSFRLTAIAITPRGHYHVDAYASLRTAL
ncbi:hypothetical protein [Bradyrhizobium sp. CB82]|uniref:hypothetical protein n=1 Tax=Bradyrhizobium sp. CB82 TaxID=3039159 RepID=UPI0032C2134E